MWFTREVAVVVASMFMMLICHTESIPDTSHLSNCALVGLFGGPSKECVPHSLCCDDCDPENIFGCADIRGIIEVNAVERENSSCPDLSSVCCSRKCPTPTDHTTPRPTPLPTSPRPTPLPKPVQDPNQCGIRNPNGVRMTVTDFQDNQAQFGEFPWMVVLLNHDNDTYVGGASLVHPRVVLTAAHRVHDQTESGRLYARIGDWNLAKTTESIPSQSINVEKVLIHPDFILRRMRNNVALLILEKDADLSETVMPICLPKSGQVFDDLDCIVTGWGQDVFGREGIYQQILKKVTVPAVSNSECQSMLRNTRLGSRFNLHSSNNCAGGKSDDACVGDGGSPLVCPNPDSDNPNEYVQMGVVSWGIGCGIVGNPGVYGSIPQTVDWINQEIQKEIEFENDYDPRGGAPR